MLEKFWAWYERTYTLNISIAFGLFLLQIAHLVWLFGEVVWAYMVGEPLFSLEGIFKWLIIVVDYTEIPALISVSFIYLNELRKGWRTKEFLYFLFLNSQWLHLFWITDEFVETTFNEPGTVLPIALAWLAILIDYLEIPVMIDTGLKFFRAVVRR